MKLYILLISVVFVSADYLKDREEFIKSEQSNYIGHKIKLSAKEEKVNKLLMSAKQKELDEGFVHPESFSPATHFFLTKQKINISPVYKFLKKMPKGGSLHLHDTGLVTTDYVLKNITYREHLLYCDDEEGFKLAFADPPPQDDCWKSFKELRENATSIEEFDSWFRSKLTVETNTPYEKYPNINAVWKAFQGVFDLQTPMLTYRPVFEDYIYQALQEFYDDNVNYMEIRSILSVVYDLNGWPLNPIQVLGLIQNIVDRFSADHPKFLGAKFIYAPSRQVDEETVHEYIEIFKIMKELYPDFLIGFDLVSQEDKGKPLIKFINQLVDAAGDIKFFFHAGETNWNGMSTDMNLVDAILLNTTRLGHAFAILKHPGVMSAVAAHGVAMELCPLSHQILNLIRDLRNHPAAALMTQDFPIVIASDAPGIWGADPLTHDFYETFMGIASSTADLRFLKQMALNSFIYSGLNSVEKEEIIIKYLVLWDEFIDNVAKHGF